MLVIALAMVIPPLAPFARYGDFTVQEFPWGAYFTNGEHTLTDPDPLTDVPELSPDGKKLVLTYTERLSYLDSQCEMHTISREMEYLTMPLCVTPGRDLVVFYNGAFHYLPADMESREAFLAASDWHLVEARSYAGELLWKKRSIDIGSPLFRLPGDRFLTVREEYSEVGINGFIFRVITKDGSRVRSWKVPYIPWYGVGKDKYRGGMSWTRLGNSGTAFRLTQVENGSPLPRGFRATIKINGRRFEFHIESPFRKRYVRWSKT